MNYSLLKTFLLSLGFCQVLTVAAQDDTWAYPELSPIPEIPAKKPLNSVRMQSSSSFEEVQLDIPITDGPFKANWVSIEKNYPGTPQWLRDAKFGIWVHFGPQSYGQSGDWYARRLYNENDGAYSNHIQRFGHPSEFGYKDVLNEWNPKDLDPDYLTQLYQQSGARFLMIQGVHHDNYDLWNSHYQPWNSVNIGPHRDLLGEWSKACHKYGMRYGVTFHHEYTWWWWQTAFGSDSRGKKKGVPYDGNMTLADGKGKWWEGYDPRMLYGIDLREYETIDERAHSGWSAPSDGIFQNHLDYSKWYATQWALRMMDVVHNYDPDFIYTDGTVQGPFTGNGTGSGYKCNAMQTVMADYYNETLKKRGEVNTFSIIKFRSATNGAVTTEEFGFPEGIRTDQEWIREAPIGDWFYAPGFVYDAPSVVRFIIEAASRDGNAALNVCLNPDGAIDATCVTMLKKVGEWMETNGDAIYGSKAWKTLGEGADGVINTLPGGGLGSSQANHTFTTQDIRYTVGKDNNLYAICMATPTRNTKVKFTSLGYATQYVNQLVSSVNLLGYDGEVEFKQDMDQLTITMPTVKTTMMCPVFQILFGGESDQKPTLSDVIANYETKIAAIQPTSSENTGKMSQKSLETFSAAIEAAKACIGGDEDAALTALNKEYINFKTNGYNQGGAPNKTGSTDITIEYLKESSNFSRTAATDNGKRFGVPLNWSVHNFNIPQSNNDGIKHGIDSYSGSNALMLGVWNDRDANTYGSLSNARICKKVSLPAGRYYFGATYNTIYNLSQGYIFASKYLSNTSMLESKSIAFWPINKASVNGPFMGIYFTLAEDQDIYLGFQANLTGANCQEFRASEVMLLSYGLPTGVEKINLDSNSAPSPTTKADYYNLSGQKIAEPPHHGIYIEREGTKVLKKMKR